MDKKKILLFIIPILLLVLLVGGTYAWYSWSTTSEDETVLITTSAGGVTVYFDGGSDITDVKLIPTATKEEGIVKKVTVRAKEETLYKLSFNLYLDVVSIDDALKDASYKYAIYKDGTLVKEGNFSQDYLDNNLVTCTTNNTNHIVLIEDDTITTTKSTYTLYLWIDGNMDNSYTMGDKSSQFKLHAYGENANLADTVGEYITNLYTNASKNTITNNGIKYYQTKTYDIDNDSTSSGGLMNDRLGGTTADYNAGNIRYYGANPSNYVDIGDTEIDSNGNEIPTLYRIIGLFKNITIVNDDGTTETKDLIKVIRNDIMGAYPWDNQSSRSNNWAEARLMMLLNPGYEEGYTASNGNIIYGFPGSLYWNSESGSCYYGTANGITPCDFKTNKTGLSTDAQEKIETVVWDLKGWNDIAIYPNAMYDKERNGEVYGTQWTVKWKGKIALMYASDYGYATNLDNSICSATLDNYGTSANSYGCRNNNWLYYHSYQWTLFFSSPFPLPVDPTGGISWNSAVNSDVRPVFYLNSNLVILSGNGTQTDPYVLG